MRWTAFSVIVGLLFACAHTRTAENAEHKSRNEGDARPTAVDSAATVPAATTSEGMPPEIDEDNLYVFDPINHTHFSAIERKELILQWGACSAEIYNELLIVAQLESGNSAYTGTNCAFNEQVAVATEQRRLLVGAVEAKDWPKARRLFARVLYISQSFYAYSNYTELIALIHHAPDLAPIVKLWDSESLAALNKIADLHSGTDLSSSPKKCSVGVPSRRELSKALGGHSRNDVLVGWKGWTKGGGARYLAARTGMAWAREVQERFPEVLGRCGPLVLVAITP